MGGFLQPPLWFTLHFVHIFYHKLGSLHRLAPTVHCAEVASPVPGVLSDHAGDGDAAGGVVPGVELSTNHRQLSQCSEKAPTNRGGPNALYYSNCLLVLVIKLPV